MKIHSSVIRKEYTLITRKGFFGKAAGILAGIVTGVLATKPAKSEFQPEVSPDNKWVLSSGASFKDSGSSGFDECQISDDHTATAIYGPDYIVPLSTSGIWLHTEKRFVPFESINNLQWLVKACEPTTIKVTANMSGDIFYGNAEELQRITAQVAEVAMQKHSRWS